MPVCIIVSQREHIIFQYRSCNLATLSIARTFSCSSGTPLDRRAHRPPHTSTNDTIIIITTGATATTATTNRVGCGDSVSPKPFESF